VKTVDIVASGYEWVCPHCKTLNKEIEWKEDVECGKCLRWYKAAPPEHAYA
jgi:hypothetical protein